MNYLLHEFGGGFLRSLKNMGSVTEKVMRNPFIRGTMLGVAPLVNAGTEFIDFVTEEKVKPRWRLFYCGLGSSKHPVRSEVVFSTPFMQLRRFHKVGFSERDEPTVLLLAPLSGHYATLLRDTVRSLLEDHVVYVSEWVNAKQIPKQAGAFGLDDFIDHILKSIKWIYGAGSGAGAGADAGAVGTSCHIIAVCQPAPAALVAAGILAKLGSGKSKMVSSLTLMGGPIDPTANETEVTKLAKSHSIDWFRSHMVQRVPYGYAGAGRRVYPGFMQLGAFISMNPKRHTQAYGDYFRHLVGDDEMKIEQHEEFYREYLSVMDICEEFYLDTIDSIFQRNLVGRNKYVWRGEAVDFGQISHPYVLIVEGGRDDISAVGQSKAAIDLLSGLSPADKCSYHLEPQAGHYGIFSGKRFRSGVLPCIKSHIARASADHDAHIGRDSFSRPA